jgi:hypothetical protein
MGGAFRWFYAIEFASCHRFQTRQKGQRLVENGAPKGAPYGAKRVARSLYERFLDRVTLKLYIRSA